MARTQFSRLSQVSRRLRFFRTSSGTFLTLLSRSVSAQSLGIFCRENSSSRFSRARLSWGKKRSGSGGVI